MGEDGTCLHGSLVCEPCAYDRGLAEGARRERERLRGIARAAYKPGTDADWSALLVAIMEEE